MRLAEEYGVYLGEFEIAPRVALETYECNYKSMRIQLPARSSVAGQSCVFEDGRETTFEKAWMKLRSL